MEEMSLMIFIYNSAQSKSSLRRSRSTFQMSRKGDPQIDPHTSHMKRQANPSVLCQNMLFLTICSAYGIPLRDGNEQTDEEAEGPFSDDEMVTHKGLRRTQSMKSVKTIKGRKEVSVHWVTVFVICVRDFLLLCHYLC